jgi:hypothetical protein
VEKTNDSKTNESPTKSGKFYFYLLYRIYYSFLDASAAIVPDKSSVSKGFDSESDDGFDSVAPKKSIRHLIFD